MIKESVRTALNEGKHVNNKPGFWDGKYFREDARNAAVGGDFDEICDKIMSIPDEETRKKIADDLVRRYKEKQKEAIRKHDERQRNKPYYQSDEQYYKDRYKNNKRLAQMLKFMDVSVKDYKNMDEDEQEQLWDDYNWHQRIYNSPEQRRAREWDEMGDPNWDAIYNAHGW